MSSPLGGFYIGARNRVHKAEAQEQARIQLTINVSVVVDETVLIDLTQTIYADQSSVLQNDNVTVQITPDILDSALVQFVCEIQAKGAYASYGVLGIQEVNVQSGEVVTTRLTGDVNARLTVGCEAVSKQV